MARRTQGSHLRALELFSECTPAELAEIDALTTRLRLAQGQVLLREGSHDRQFMVIVDGSVGVSRDGGQPIAVLTPGDFVGEMAMLTGVARSATVTALTPVEILVCNSAEFFTVVETAPSVARKLAEATERRAAANAKVA